ncbi:spore germination protein [Clostridium ganghwense]|uniref:Spore germination protein n=1 Tax=Clostridium ganghwense TaxID=312089 RepID=A0ABT4CNX0_9CLOT|nr:spore germination protein [Clostridium ganghwense]MCY6370722.1 spore germination protein [Clostridium ganghwense]
MESTILSNDLEKNITLISSNAPANFNFKTRELILKDNIKCIIIYIEGLSKKEDIESCIISPLLSKIDCDINALLSPASYIGKRYITINDIELSSDVNVISKNLKKGKSIILIEHDNTAIICNTSQSNFKKFAESKIEENIRGEKSAFVNNLHINVSLIQEKLKNNNLKIELYTFGEENNCEASLIYLENTIDPDVLNKIKSKLQTVKTSYVPDTGYLMQFIEKRPLSIFPQSKLTEKPDKVVSDIIQGKAAIFVNGCAYAIVLPVVFVEFFQAFEDYSNRLILANFDRFIRFLALLIILTASPIYLVLIKYYASLIPLNLIKIIIISRKNIPLPPFLEILSMELLIEFLREGGLRLPSTIGQTLSIIGGIIIGDAAIKSGIVSPTTLVVTALTVISTFLIPNYEMSLSIRLLRFYILILAQFFGFFGIFIGLFSIFAHLINLDSFGIPYFSPFAPMRFKDLKDSTVRYSLKDTNRIPISFIRRKIKNKKNE